MNIQRQFLTPNKYSRPQSPLKKVLKIAVHYVGNAGSSAQGNRNYFESLKNGKGIYASSHYIIGLNGEIIQCIPENEWSYATNEANGYSISIENCHPTADGKFTQATRQSLIELCADICQRYNLNPLKDIIRHYDVTGKQCPLYWVNHPDDFVKFKNEVKAYMEGDVDMGELNKLKERIAALENRLTEDENGREKVFNTLDEIPEWGKPTVQKLLAKGILNGTGASLDITYTLLRLLVINDRAGVYDTI